MEFLRGLAQGDWWYRYDILLALFGVLLCFLIKKDPRWNRYLSLVICVLNAWWLGAIFLFRYHYNATSFVGGGILGVMLVILFFLLCRGKWITSLAAFFICAKMLCLALHLLAGRSYGRIEKLIVFFSFVFSVILIMGFHLARNMKMFNPEYATVSKILFPLYGSFLITGCWYDFFHEITYDISDYLIEKKDYINFYKYIAKTDWMGNGTALLFTAIFLFVFLSGFMLQNHDRIERKEG